MTFLLDTNLLLWSVFERMRVPPAAVELLLDPSNDFVFSVASIWEVAIKSAKHPQTFFADAAKLRSSLLSLGYLELLIASEHAIASAGLPFHHRDPFDRLLVAQAIVEDLRLLTVDGGLTAYSSLIAAV
ncbi:hypothetical protein Terro_3224 [Terriglobus roseus DSM 18391]|uniref:PIN domain-containing protein n=1 Tax=Terriglobus roseus (strain DSM 18391 / NRRL B-41598 / KBS 63) TaxID=926566 RepID=I3ZJM4_TERRK|nr:type II toxin-antitoxin system VapC family toxin [Terriglobus roseus]AFL89442.1 hypothetical protein Terro_3224 [Terriglobus roseus DSM 18391]